MVTVVQRPTLLDILTAATAGIWPQFKPLLIGLVKSFRLVTHNAFEHQNHLHSLNSKNIRYEFTSLWSGCDATRCQAMIKMCIKWTPLKWPSTSTSNKRPCTTSFAIRIFCWNADWLLSWLNLIDCEQFRLQSKHV